MLIAPRSSQDFAWLAVRFGHGARIRLPSGWHRQSNGHQQYDKTTFWGHFAELCLNREIDDSIREECD
jgi:hypothetical protein